MFCDQVVVHDPAAYKVLLDNPFQHRRIACAVPGAFGIDDGNRPAFADAEAVRLRAQDPALFGQTHLLEALLQKLPRREPAIALAAFRFRLIAAEKNVPPRHWHADGCGDLALRITHVEQLAPAPSPYTPKASGSHSSPNSLGGAMYPTKADAATTAGLAR